MTNKLMELADRLGSPEITRLVNNIISSAQLDSKSETKIEGQINARDLVEMNYDVLDALKDAIIFNLRLEKDPDGKGNNIIAIPTIQDKWTDGLNLGDISKIPGLAAYVNVEKQSEPTNPIAKIEKPVEKPKITPKPIAKKEEKTELPAIASQKDELAALLVKMADKCDSEGDFETASEIDQALQSFATRPKAPLKNLDDSVKKNLIIFIGKADKNIKDSIDGLNEFLSAQQDTIDYLSANNDAIRKTSNNTAIKR